MSELSSPPITLAVLAQPNACPHFGVQENIRENDHYSAKSVRNIASFEKAKLFESRLKRNEHVRIRHLKRHQCDECGKRFGERDKLRNHQLTHTGKQS
jgi:hypothetical protein